MLQRITKGRLDVAGRKLRGMAVVREVQKDEATPAKDARWPFVMLYLFMWMGMITTTLNTDPIKFEYSIAVVIGLLIVLGIVGYLAYGRIRGLTLFTFDKPTLLGNVAWHIFILTGVLFIGFLFFLSVAQIMILSFGAPLFEPSCVTPSQRDVALFVWDAMAKGAFKFLARYLHLSPDGCAPNVHSTTASATSLGMTAFTSLVLVWYAISLAKAYYRRLSRS
jgi:hypothetical protein